MLIITLIKIINHIWLKERETLLGSGGACLATTEVERRPHEVGGYLITYK